MKISHTTHSYLSPTKLNSITTVKIPLLSPANTDDDDDDDDRHRHQHHHHRTRTSSFTPTDLNKLIIDHSDTTLIGECNDDETNDNILSAIAYKPAAAATTKLPSPESLTSDTLRENALVRDDNSLDFIPYNGSMDIDDTLPALSTATPKSSSAAFRFSSSIDYSDVPTTPRSMTNDDGSCNETVGGSSGGGAGNGISSTLKPTTPDFLAKDFTHLNRIQNADDLFSFTATTNTTATSSTLNSWNEANYVNKFTRKEISHSSSCCDDDVDDGDDVDGGRGGGGDGGRRTRRPFLSNENRFLSLSISPPLTRRQDMPVLRGTFVSLYVKR